MMFVSNPKLTMLVLVILTLTLLPQPILMVNGATTYTRGLPSNTIYFDNFENGGNGTWLKFTFGSPTGNIVGVNKTRSFDGNASYGIYDPVINSQVEVQKTVATSATIIGIQAWTTFNYAMYAAANGQAPELALEYYTSNGNHHQALVEYRPARGEWVLFGDPTSPDNSNNPFILYTFPGSITLRKGYMAYNDQLVSNQYGNTWYWVKYVIDITAQRYVSLCTDVGCFANATNYFVGQIGTGSTTFPEQHSIRIGMKITNDGTASASNALFSDLLVTDEGAVVPPIIQFGVSLFSGWFPILIASIGILYGTSGIGLARRVILGKTEGMLQSYKLIIVTGVVATVGFISILAIGALLTRQVCQSQHIATCSY